MAAKCAGPVLWRVTVGSPGMLSQCQGVLVFARSSKSSVLEVVLGIGPTCWSNSLLFLRAVCFSSCTLLMDTGLSPYILS